MVNGRLALGRDHDFVVEIQLHVRSLFELKGDLHVLYEGARILGAMEATTTTHDGVLSDDALARDRIFSRWLHASGGVSAKST